MSFPQNLKNLRKQFGMKQDDLASVLNISKSNISKYENGDLEPSLKTLIQICSIFKVSMDELIGLPQTFISPRNDFVDDFNVINNSIVESKFQPYLEQFSEIIFKRFKDSSSLNKASVTITLDFLDDLFNTHNSDELKSISEDIMHLWSKYVSQRIQ